MLDALSQPPLLPQVSGQDRAPGHSTSCSPAGKAPNGGKKQQVEFTLIDVRAQMDRYRAIAYGEMERAGRRGRLSPRLWQASIRHERWRARCGGYAVCGSPYQLSPHAPLGRGSPLQDTMIPETYFELLCAAPGLARHCDLPLTL